MSKYDVDPGRLIHALQNHDELTMGISHFGAHAQDCSRFAAPADGAQLGDLVRREM